MSRRDDLNVFYDLLNALKEKIGGFRHLRDCSAKSGWPERGVYFFFESGEFREEGRTPRVVWVGTHAVSNGSRRTLWQRLSQHKGSAEGKGNHRASILRKRIGEALLQQGAYPQEVHDTWNKGSKAPKAVSIAEESLELDVSRYICEMPLLWLEVDDPPSKQSKRAYFKQSAIALLSNSNKPRIDRPSDHWLGLKSLQHAIRDSGLWNTNGVEGEYGDEFLNSMAHAVERHRS